ncbi:hypothetical protein MMC18_004604 [Xylographa bjoerkii]|nr:hypothetical protein [Xylographa bjoerkii]
MPENAMETKVIAAKRFGAEVFSSGRSWGERDAVLRVLHNRTGATIVSSSSDPEIILGQGTIGLEFVSQVKRLHNLSLDAIIAPCGGGGMLSGLGVALRDSSINVFGAEPDEGGADDAARGRADGKRIETVDSATIADGLRCPVGRLPWEIIKNPEYIEDIYAVGDVQIRTAMKLILEYMGMVVEPSAAVPLAVVLFNKEFRSYVASRPRAWRVGVVLSGGNVGVDDFNAMLL